jgi:murein DD-endopeptidase MepM/ murein hydrolase activator NlpD
MIWKIKLGRYQLSLRRVGGRPKKTIFSQIREYFSYLRKIAEDKRFSGNPVSRVLRRIFETKKIRQLFGVNLLTIAIVSGAVSPSISAISPNEMTEITSISPKIVQLTTQNSVRWPVEEIRITQGFHQYHKAIDLAEPVGSPVYPIMDGVVESISYQRFGYGNHIIIDHGSGFKSLYAHLSKVIIKKGQEVDKNTVLGLVGSTGRSTGPHLHLEVHDNGQPFNPLMILK